MNFLSEDMLITVGNKKGLRLYNRKGELLDDVLSGLYSGSNLCDVSADRSGSVIVVAEDRGSNEPGCLDVLKKLPEEWQPETHDVCCQPIAVAFMKNGGFVANDSRMKMHRYDRDGNILWQSALKAWSHTICVDHRGRILVCYKTNSPGLLYTTS